MWTKDEYSLEGRYYTIKNARLAPKPVQKPWPVLYAGGESAAAKDLIARECDAYLMHGDPPEALAIKVEDMRARRAKHPDLPPLRFGVAAYSVVRSADAEVKKEIARITDVRASARGYASYQEFIKGSQLDTKVSLEDYSVSNRGLRTGLVGTPEQVAVNVRELARIGIDLVLLQCSPQREEMQRFSSEVFPLGRDLRNWKEAAEAASFCYVRSIVAARGIESYPREREASDRTFVREEMPEAERGIGHVDAAAALNRARREEQPLGSPIADAFEAADDIEDLSGAVQYIEHILLVCADP
jgi:hypothetical protein